MQVRVTAIIILLVLAFTASAAPPAHSIAHANRVTGTYSTLHLNKTAGDLLGIEVRIVRTDKGYKATIQAAEGGPGDIYIVDVMIDDSSVSFDIPYTADVKGHFSGKVSPLGLVGVLTYPSQEAETTTLPRTNSYWER